MRFSSFFHGSTAISLCSCPEAEPVSSTWTPKLCSQGDGSQDNRSNNFVKNRIKKFNRGDGEVGGMKSTNQINKLYENHVKEI